jgi:uncharacterized RDD family membrane protein YckC
MAIYGGFWIRVVGYIIDAILMGVVGSVLGAILGIGGGFAAALDAANADTAMAGAQFASAGIGIVIGWLYYALMESSAYQATVGKMVFGLVVTDLNGNRISFARATGRHFAKWLSSIILLIGFIMVAFTERKQGLHDMVAGTLVTKKGSLQGTDTARVFS